MTRTFKVQTSVISGLFALACFMTTVGALAGNALSGDEIKAMMADTTVEGKMNDGSAYSEFYQADGKIKAKDYAGKWSVESDSMCFDYTTQPGKMCYQIGRNATGIDWIKDGKVEGTGTVSKGNIRNY